MIPSPGVSRLPLDSFTVPLHSSNGRHLPAVKAVQGDCRWPLRNVRNHVIPFCIAVYKWFIAGEEFPSLYLDQSTIQPATSAISCPNEQSYNRLLGLCYSLGWRPVPRCWSRRSGWSDHVPPTRKHMFLDKAVSLKATHLEGLPFRWKIACAALENF